MEILSEHLEDEDSIVRQYCLLLLILCDVHIEVSYKWLSRKLNVPSDSAKR